MPTARGGQLHCFRCAYVWRSRAPHPRICPRCKSRLWDAPRFKVFPRGTGSGVQELLLPNRDQILALALQHKARRVRVFGSVARSAATPKSDIDLLVDFDEGASAFDQVELILDLQELLRRKVDVVEEGGLHWLVKPQVLHEAVAL